MGFSQSWDSEPMNSGMEITRRGLLDLSEHTEGSWCYLDRKNSICGWN